MRALTIFFDRISQKYQEYSNHAIIVNDQYEPLIVTQFDIFSLPFSSVSNYINNLKARSIARTLILTLAWIFLLLGIFSATLYLLFVADILYFSIDAQSIIFVKEFIYIAGIALIVLWFDIKEQSGSQNTLQKYPVPDEILSDSIALGAFTPLQFSAKDVLPFVHPMLTKIIEKSLVSKDSTLYIDSRVLLKELVFHPHTLAVFQSLEILDAREKLSRASLSKDEAPMFTANAIQSLLLYSLEYAINTESQTVYPEHLLLAIFASYPALNNILETYAIPFDLLEKSISWLIWSEERDSRVKKLNSIAKRYRYERNFAKFFKIPIPAINFIGRPLISLNPSPIIMRGKDDQFQTIFSAFKRGSIPRLLIYGRDGTGRHTLVKSLAQNIAEGTVPREMLDYSLIQIDTNLLFAEISRRKSYKILFDELENYLIENPRTILYFEDLLDAFNKIEDSTTAKAILSFINGVSVPIIMLITPEKLKAFQKNHQSFINSFIPIQLSEPDIRTTLEILISKLSERSEFNKKPTFNALLRAVSLTSIFIEGTQPAKTIELLNKASEIVSEPKKKIIETTDVFKAAEYILSKNIDIHFAMPRASQLLNLKTELHEEYVNQDSAIDSVISQLVKQVKKWNEVKPIEGVFLFAGPIGAGKNTLAKLIAKHYLKNEHAIFTINCNDFIKIKPADISKAITTKTKMFPVATYIIENIDALNPSNLEIMLTELIATSQEFAEQRLGPQSILIVLTSNRYAYLFDEDKNAPERAKKKILQQFKDDLSPGMLNMINDIVVFRPLSYDELAKVTEMFIKDVEADLLGHGFSLMYSDVSIYSILHKINKNDRAARGISDFIDANIYPAIKTKMIDLSNNPLAEKTIYLDPIIDTLPYWDDNKIES